jgi:hypothetical protein
VSLEILLAERDITQQLTKFARAMDARDWESIANITAEDIRADFGLGEIRGRTALIQHIRSFLDTCGTTQHLLGNIIIQVNGTQATSESYVSDMHLCQDPDKNLYFRTLGNYSDAWTCINGVWLLNQRVKDNRALMGSMDVFKP